jgi:hypothetical protein
MNAKLQAVTSAKATADAAASNSDVANTALATAQQTANDAKAASVTAEATLTASVKDFELFIEGLAGDAPVPAPTPVPPDPTPAT